MKKNICKYERWARVIAGIVLIALAAMGKIGLWGYVGIIPLVTGLLAFCPIYTLLGIGKNNN